MKREAVMAFVAVAVVAACAEPPARNLVSTGRPIVGGTADTNPAHMATVAITNQPGSYFCSGTLITESVVLTAAHCLEDYWGNPLDPATLQVFFGNNAYSSGEYRQVSEGRQHPEWNRSTLQRDIAILRLASAAPSNITPIPYLPSSLGLTQADVGATVDFSGFGLTESGSDGQKLHVQNQIDVVCDDPGGCDGGNVVQYGMGYDETPGGPCSGDSGGPAYFFRNGTEYVAGVTSYGDQNCQYFGVSTMADRYSAFIDDFINSGTAEICDNDMDDDGDNLVDCDDPGCSTDPNCRGPSACSLAQVINCGDTVTGNSADGVSEFVNYYCPSGGVSERGPEIAYLLNAPQGAQVMVDMTLGSGGDLDLFLINGQDGDCDPSDCADVSGESNQAAEHLSFVKGAGEQYLVIETWDYTNTYTLTVTCGQPEDCTNGTDDDGDGLADCDDSDCAQHPDCVPDSACTNAQVITCGDSVTGDTNNGLSVFSRYSCLSNAQEAGPEVAFELDIPTGINVTADMENAQGSDLDLFLVAASGGSCDPNSCLDFSGNYQTPEQINFTMPAGGAYLIVETWENPASFTLSITCSSRPENCTNGTDDDGDRLVDCEDPDCADNPACKPPEDCSNGTDDDGDGKADCEDTDCIGDPACQPPAEDCTNGTDDDGDGLADCADGDCANDPACQPPAEDCTNGTDDDGDGFADCADSDCANDPACQQASEDCTNGTDDDGDGFADCADSDCANDPACQQQKEICDDGADNDGDGVADCQDSDCLTDPACKNQPSGEGCGCNTGSHPTGGALAILLVGLLVAPVRRRDRWS